jgi:hypothetical protein
MIQNTAEELAWLVQETERLVRHVEDVRVRIAAGSKRRTGSTEAEPEARESSVELINRLDRAPSPLAPERAPSTPPSDRTPGHGSAAPGHVSVSKWLPPLSPHRNEDDSDVYTVMKESSHAGTSAPRRPPSGSHSVWHPPSLHSSTHQDETPAPPATSKHKAAG